MFEHDIGRLTSSVGLCSHIRGARKPRRLHEKVFIVLVIDKETLACHKYKHQWFSGKIHRCHRWAPRSIRG